MNMINNYYEKESPQEQQRRRSKKYYQKHRERELARTKKKYWDNWEFYKKYREENKEKIRTQQKKGRQKVKNEVLTHYGGGQLKCIKCGCGDFRVLSIDHIDGGGTKETRLLGSSDKLYRNLRKNDFPKGYQTLCMNCQWIKRYENKEWRH